jgi:hypothetical protein
MSKKRPFFKSRVGFVPRPSDEMLITKKESFHDNFRVRVVDARELTPEKAVEKVLQSSILMGEGWREWCEYNAAKVGMTATITNGKVSVRKIKESKR